MERRSKRIDWLNPTTLEPWLGKSLFGPTFKFSRRTERLASILFLAGMAVICPFVFYAALFDTVFSLVVVLALPIVMISFSVLMLGRSGTRLALVVDLDEREQRERDVAHLYAYRIVFSLLIWIMGYLALADTWGLWRPETDKQWLYIFIFMFLWMAALPRIVYVWINRDLDDSALETA